MSFGICVSSVYSNNVLFKLYYRTISEYLDSNTLKVEINLTIENRNAATLNVLGKRYSLRVGDIAISGVTREPFCYQNSEKLVASMEAVVPADKSLIMRGYFVLNDFGITSITTPDYYYTFNLLIKSHFTFSGEPHSINRISLGSRYHLIITKPSAGTVSTIYYNYGSGLIYLYNKSSDAEYYCTLPESIANNYTNVASITAVFTIETYWDNGDGTYVYKGSDQELFRLNFPSTMIPSASLSITDGKGYLDDFGSFLHSESNYAVSITDILSYGSPIVSYNTVVTGVTADGGDHSSNYYGKTFTTGVLNIVGTVTFTTTLVDARGRTGVVTKTVNAVRYVPPLIYDLAVHRCDQDGTEDGQGEYVTFSFSSTVQSLTNNTAHYWFKYKSSEDQSYTVVDLPTLQNNFSVTNHSEIIQANSDYSYEVVVLVQDGVMTTEQSTRASTAATILNFSPGGTGIGIGKVAEEENLLDVGMPTRFRSSVTFDDADGILAQLGAVDYIVETGTSGGWQYVKYASKRLDLYREGNCSVSSFSSAGSVYYRDTSIDLPSFVTAIHVTSTSANMQLMYISNHWTNIANHKFYFCLVCPWDPGAGTYNYQIMIKGLYN